jgi:hypothetical protein
MGKQLSSLEQAAKLVEEFGVGPALTTRIRALEAAGVGLKRGKIEKLLAREDVGEELIAAAGTIKVLAGQVHVIRHAAGILVSLPHILEPGEVVQSLSLGAGNTGRNHDLETDRRVAEFTFIDWQGADTMRQNKLFADVINLASSKTTKRRVVYVLGTSHAMKFLGGGRAIRSVLSKNSKARLSFEELYGHNTFVTVSDYWATVHEKVEILDLRELVPDVFAARPHV